MTEWPSYIPQAPGDLFIPSYGSQACGGDSLTRLHTGKFVLNKYYRMKSKGMDWEGHVACMGQMRNTYKILVGKLEVYELTARLA
jgi:hypothetical protein